MDALPSAVTAKGTSTPSTPLLTVKSPDKLAADAKAKATPVPVRDFKSLLDEVWTKNRSAKLSDTQETGHTIQDRIIANMRARYNRIDPADVAKIKAAVGGSVRRLNVTGMKCRQADAWAKDVFSSTDKPWRLDLSAVPEPSPQVLAEAAQASLASGGGVVAVEAARGAITESLLEGLARADKTLRDKLDAADFTGVLLSCLPDMTTGKAGIIKGPLAGPDKSVRFARVSPLDAFPASGAVGFEDGDFVERFRIDRGEVERLLGSPGYDDGALRKVLATWDSVSADDLNDTTIEERDRLENVALSDKRAYAWGRDFWVRVSGAKLKALKCEKWTKAPRSIDELKTYDMNALMIGPELVFLGENTDYEGRRPYRKTGWDKIDGSFWYESLPEQLEDVQAIMTNCTRGLLNNLAWVQGPCIEVDMERLPPGEPLTHAPMRTWQARNRGAGANAPAVRYQYHESKIAEYGATIEMCFRLADQIADIPALTAGVDRPGGGVSTVGGMSMLLNGANRGFKQFLLRISAELHAPLIKDTLTFMKKRLKVPGFDIPDPEIKPSGVVVMMARDSMADRRLAFLDRMNQEGAGDIISPTGKAAIYRELAESMEIKGVDLIRPPEELAAIDQQKQQNAQAEAQARIQAEQAKAQESQLKMMEVQAKIREIEARLQLEQMKVQLEMQLASNEARVQDRELQLKEIATQQASERLELDRTQLQVKTTAEFEKLSAAQALNAAKIAKDQATTARHQMGVAKDAIDLQGGAE